MSRMGEQRGTRDHKRVSHASYRTTTVRYGRAGVAGARAGPAVLLGLLLLPVPGELRSAEAAEAAALEAGAQRRAARGWLQLEQDQRAARERLPALELRRERELGTVERGQRTRLRALEQRDARRTERQQRQLQRPRQSALEANPVPRRDLRQDLRNRAEQLRQRIRIRQDLQRFRRR